MTARSKETYLGSMNEEYKQKHYPEGSMFKAYKRTMRGVDAGLGLFLMGVFLVSSIVGLVWSISGTLEITRDKEKSVLGAGIEISVLFLLLVVVFEVIISFIAKGIRKTADNWTRAAAKTGGLREQKIRELGKQTVGSDSLILSHLGKLKSFTTGQKGGILVRDYIYLYGGNIPCILKLNRLTQAYIEDNTYYMKVGKIRKQARYLTVHLTTGDKKTAWAETSREAARTFQGELESRCLGINTAGGSVLSR